MKAMAVISYNGTDFCGYQIQKNERTVQNEIEKSLFQICQRPIKINSSGRTDSKVHALGQVISFEVDINISLDRLHKALNSLLPDDIYIKTIDEVDSNFHARYSAVKKEYNYYINTGQYDVFNKDYIYQYNKELDVEAMKEGIKYFVGEHDFKSFTPTKNIQENYTRIIYKAEINKSENNILIKFVGNGFLRYMVRNMVGCLISIGEGKLKPIDIKQFLEKKDRRCHYKTANPEGLYLMMVDYE